MRLNQVTVTMPDLDEGWRFYSALDLIPIVDARPRSASRDGENRRSLHSPIQ
jgi:hypothetical protein